MVQQALVHPYVVQFHNPNDLPLLTSPLKIGIDDDQKYSISEYRNNLYNDILRKKKILRQRQLQRNARAMRK
jgi:mitogen-activated protein kinase 15